MAGRTVTIWPGLRSIQVLLDGRVVGTVAFRVRPEDLRHLPTCGARPSWPPGKLPVAAPERRPGCPRGPCLDIDRAVNEDGVITIAGIHPHGLHRPSRSQSPRLA